MPWGPIAAVLYTALAFIMSSQILANVILIAIVGTGASAEAWFNTTAGQFYYVLIADVIFFLFLWAFIAMRSVSIKILGMARKPVWQDVVHALLGYAVYFLVFLALTIAAGSLTGINLDQKQELGFDFLSMPSEKMMAFISLVLLPPLIEEIAFRGFMFAGLRKKLDFVWAALITSVIFASLHLPESSNGLLWIGGLDTFVLSMVLCYLREKTGALWASMAVHGIKNGIAFILILTSVAAR